MTTTPDRRILVDGTGMPFAPDQHVAIGASAFMDRTLCSCGAVVLADWDQRAWVNAEHYLPFGTPAAEPVSAASGPAEDERDSRPHMRRAAFLAARGIRPGAPRNSPTKPARSPEARHREYLRRKERGKVPSLRLVEDESDLPAEA